MGVSLIVTGALLLISMFYKEFDLVWVMKFAPVILVFLGIETLIAYFTNDGEKIKYDFLAGFYCFLLICTAFILTAATWCIQNYGRL